MLCTSSYAAILAWMRRRFGVDFAELEEGQYQLIAHQEDLADYNGVYVWYMGLRAVVSAPEWMLNHVRLLLAARIALPREHARVLVEESFWREALGERIERVIGPAYQGFADKHGYRPAETQGARPLTLTDHQALRDFIAACPPDDWRDSAISSDHQPIFGLLRDGELIAAASAPLQKPRLYVIRSVGVVTLPAWRGTGAGLAVVSALGEHMLLRNPTIERLRYQTLRSNLPSVAIAQRLGFEDVATTLAIRLRTP